MRNLTFVSRFSPFVSMLRSYSRLPARPPAYLAARSLAAYPVGFNWLACFAPPLIMLLGWSVGRPASRENDHGGKKCL